MTWRRQRKIFLSRSTDGERTGGFFWREGKKKRVKVEEEEELVVVVVKEERRRMKWNVRGGALLVCQPSVRVESRTHAAALSLSLLVTQ